MLIKKSHREGDVVSVKLTNDGELLARFESDNADTVTVSKPMRVVIVDRAGNIGLIPWINTGVCNMVDLPKTQIIVCVPAIQDYADQYIEGTTGIALAK